jgi:MazG family protein
MSRGRQDDERHDGAPGGIARLIGIMAALRHPETGCPWDLEQTFATIAPYTIEEAYEVADTIATGDIKALQGELGDLLFQVVYHARIAEEQGAFALADVVTAISDKLVRRHPHVFGSPEQRKAGVTPGFWERIKAEERAEEAAKPGNAAPSSLLDDVPQGMPGLTRAVKLQDKAARVGFDWPDLAPVLAKMREEVTELEEATAGGNRDRIEDELGDVLFVLANVARWLEVDPEAAARRANAKFARRFRYIEARLAAEGRSPERSDLAEMDRLWDEAKAGELER